MWSLSNSESFGLLVIGSWFEQYRERVIEAENMILTTLNFELNVQHPYVPLTSILNKLGISDCFSQFGNKLGQ